MLRWLAPPLLMSLALVFASNASAFTITVARSGGTAATLGAGSSANDGGTIVLDIYLSGGASDPAANGFFLASEQSNVGAVSAQTGVEPDLFPGTPGIQIDGAFYFPEVAGVACDGAGRCQQWDFRNETAFQDAPFGPLLVGTLTITTSGVGSSTITIGTPNAALDGIETTSGKVLAEDATYRIVGESVPVDYSVTFDGTLNNPNGTWGGNLNVGAGQEVNLTVVYRYEGTPSGFGCMTLDDRHSTAEFSLISHQVFDNTNGLMSDPIPDDDAYLCIAYWDDYDFVSSARGFLPGGTGEMGDVGDVIPHGPGFDALVNASLPPPSPPEGQDPLIGVHGGVYDVHPSALDPQDNVSGSNFIPAGSYVFSSGLGTEPPPVVEPPPVGPPVVEFTAFDSDPVSGSEFRVEAVSHDATYVVGSRSFPDPEEGTVTEAVVWVDGVPTSLEWPRRSRADAISGTARSSRE